MHPPSPALQSEDEIAVAVRVVKTASRSAEAPIDEQERVKKKFTDPGMLLITLPWPGPSFSVPSAILAVGSQSKKILVEMKLQQELLCVPIGTRAALPEGARAFSVE